MRNEVVVWGLSEVGRGSRMSSAKLGGVRPRCFMPNSQRSSRKLKLATQNELYGVAGMEVLRVLCWDGRIGFDSRGTVRRENEGEACVTLDACCQTLDASSV